VSRIQSGRWSELLRRATGQAGVEVVASELSPEISPTWAIEGTTPEWDFLKSTKRLLANVDLDGAGCASWRLRNPDNSSAIAIVDQIIFGCNNDTTAFTLQLEHGASDLGSLGFPIVVDSRWVPAPYTDAAISSMSFTTTSSSSYITTGALLGTFYSHGGSGGEKQQQTFHLPVVLSPGWSLTLSTLNLGARVYGNVSYSERTLPPLER